VLTTQEAASDVPAAMIATTFVGYMAAYLALLAAYVATLFVMASKGRRAEASPEGPGAVPLPGLGAGSRPNPGPGAVPAGA
jgi:cytochrome d ubiquinol oxidase subunit I